MKTIEELKGCTKKQLSNYMRRLRKDKLKYNDCDFEIHMHQVWHLRRDKMFEQKTHRVRRGKIVEIPEKWRGRTPSAQTIRKRKSKRGQGKSFKRKAMR